MNLAPQLQSLAKLLAGIAARELMDARSGNEKARTDGNRIRAKTVEQRNDST